MRTIARSALLVVSLLLTSSGFAMTLVVTNTFDSGAGSLREALLETQPPFVCPAPCEIVFNIAGPVPPGGYWRIEPLSGLKSITRRVAIDGGSQTAFSGNTNPYGPEVILSGEFAGNSPGLHVFGPSASGTTITGLQFEKWSFGVYLSPTFGSAFNPQPARDVRIIDNVFVNNVSPIFLSFAEACVIARNKIGGNSEGITVSGPRNVIEENIIGVDGANNIVGNGHFGVRLASADQTSVQANAIIGTKGSAIRVDSSSGGTLRNSMRDNAFGIDLGNDGPTANDVGDFDAGPNDLQNYPELSRRGTTLYGRLDSTPKTTFVIDIYRSDKPPPDAGTYLLFTSITITTDGSGLAMFRIPLSEGDGPNMIATATNLTTGNTSELSPPPS